MNSTEPHPENSPTSRNFAPDPESEWGILRLEEALIQSQTCRSSQAISYLNKHLLDLPIDAISRSRLIKLLRFPSIELILTLNQKIKAVVCALRILHREGGKLIRIFLHANRELDRLLSILSRSNLLSPFRLFRPLSPTHCLSKSYYVIRYHTARHVCKKIAFQVLCYQGLIQSEIITACRLLLAARPQILSNFSQVSPFDFDRWDQDLLI